MTAEQAAAVLAAALPFLEIAASFDGLDLKPSYIIPPVLWPRQLTVGDWQALRAALSTPEQLPC